MTSGLLTDIPGRNTAPPPLLDWKRSLPLVALNFVLFAGGCAFLEYLTRGRWFDFSAAAYRADLATPLGEALLHPLDVMSHPWVIAVTGLLLAAVIYVPLVTAVLYPLGLTAVFVAMVAMLGHAPALAVALAAGCVMAARTPLRTDMPFCAVAIGALPVSAYLYLFGYSDSQAVEFLPLQRWALAGPFLLAVIAAMVASAVTLALVRLTRRRAGVVWPALVLLLAGPAGILHVKIGPDELEYALLADGLATGDLVIQPTSLEQWTRTNHAEGLNQQNLVTRLGEYLRQRQSETTAQCEGFLQKHPSSDRAAEVLWLEGQCRSLQLDEPALKEGSVRFSACFAREASAQTWKQLADEFPAAGQAALASWRLGELAIQRRDVARARQDLALAAAGLKALGADQGTSRRDGRSEDRIFQSPSTIPAPGYYADALFDVRRLLWLIDVNSVVGDSEATEALGAWLSQSPNQANYAEKLEGLAGTYERTSLGDNLKLAVAMAVDDPYMQAEMLIWLAGDKDTDAAIEANYQLGMLVMQTARARALMLVPGIKTAEECFKTVLAAQPNPWQEFARAHLARLAGANRP